MRDTFLIALPLLAAALRQATPLAIAGLGGIFSERSGVVNIALEGLMLIGAFVGIAVGQLAGPWVGFIAALVAGGLVGALHLLFTQKLRMNHIVSGVALNILAINATTFLLRSMFNQADPPRPASIASPLPVPLFVVLAFMLPIVAQFVLWRTPLGLRLRAVGEAPESARMAGIPPLKMRAVGVITSGVFGALAGAYISLAQVGRFSDDMISGRGYIALAAVICGRWRPIPMLIAALAFGLFDALQIKMQGSAHIPTEALRAMPYVLTILAAMLLKPTPPAALGKQD